MAKPKISLRGAGCQKRGCRLAGALHRHHRRHQAMWLGIWVSVRKGERKFELFKQRYYQFHADDITTICERHHAEIHSIYDKIIQADRQRLGRPLSKYSWKQAEQLMDKLEAAFWDWLETESKGITSRTLRARRRALRMLNN